MNTVSPFVKLAPGLATSVLAGPVIIGLLFVLLPAFGYLPALGGTSFSLDPWRRLIAEPGVWRGAMISLAAGLITGAVSLAIKSAGLCLRGNGKSMCCNYERKRADP